MPTPSAALTSHNATLTKSVSHAADEGTGLVLSVIPTPSPSAAVITSLGAPPDKAVKAIKCSMAITLEAATGTRPTVIVSMRNALSTPVSASTVGPVRGTTNFVSIV